MYYRHRVHRRLLGRRTYLGTSAGQSADSVDSRIERIKSIVREVDEREVPVGVGYTFTIDTV